MTQIETTAVTTKEPQKDQRVAPVLSWMIPIPDETPEEFAAFMAWIEAGDEAMPLDTLRAHGLENEVAERNAWVIRRDHRFSHERLLKARVIERMQMQQINLLIEMQEYYVDDVRKLREQMEKELTGKVATTARSVRHLRDDIDRGMKGLKQVIDATVRIHSSLDQRTGLTINANTSVSAKAAAASAPPEQPDTSPAMRIYEKMAAFKKLAAASDNAEEDAVDAEVTQAPS